MQTNRTAKKNLTSSLASLRSSLGGIFGVTRVKDFSSLLNKIDRSEKKINSFLREINSGAFDDVLSNDEMGALKTNIDEIGMFLKDFKIQLQDLIDNMKVCQGNAKVVNNILNRLKNPRKKSKTVSKKKPYRKLTSAEFWQEIKRPASDSKDWKF